MAITCAISPYRQLRREARQEIGRFVEVFVFCPVEVCAKRDVKGMYKKAYAGEIKGFTGVSDPYEDPQHAELTLHTDRLDEATCVKQIISKLEAMGYLEGGLPSPHGGVLVESLATAPHPKRTLEVGGDGADEAYNIGVGAFSPLTGFLEPEELESVLERGRLSSGIPWTIPIVLPVDRSFSGGPVTLTYEGAPLAVLHAGDPFPLDRERFTQGIFGTTDEKHPGVVRVRDWPDRLVGGRVELIEPPAGRMLKWSRTPRQVREEFTNRGWKSVVAFQTRNVPHIGHEAVQKTALASVDGLLIQPLAGFKKPGDFRDEVIFAAYEALIKDYYPDDRVFLSALHLPMRYAGPREAIMHAIVRKNFGCSHLVVGRDHAGVGNFYDPYAAHRIFDTYPDLGVVPMRLPATFECRTCGGVTHAKACPHPESERVNYSGTRLRAALETGDGDDSMIRRSVLDVIRSFASPLVS